MLTQFKKNIVLIIVALSLACLVSPAYSTDMVNINTGTKQELMTLKYVGEKIADRIIEYRTAHAFKTPEEIMNVKGIGQKIFDANKDRICCNE